MEYIYDKLKINYDIKGMGPPLILLHGWGTNLHTFDYVSKYLESSYTIYMKEIIPARSDDGIEYKYKIYEASADDLESALEKVADKTKKKLYYKRCKFLVTDVDHSDFINEMLEIKPKSIYHPSDDVKDVLAKTNS